MRTIKTRTSLLVAAFLFVTCAYGGVALEPANAASVDNTAKSLNGDARAYITFYNNLSFDVDLYWINYTGDRVLYATVGANSSYVQSTFITHPWLLVKKGTGGSLIQGTGELIAAFLPFTANPSSPSEGDTATIGVGSNLSTSVVPTSLKFDGFQGGPIQKANLEIGADRPGQRFTISKVGSWLKATPNAGVTPATVLIEADPAGLPPNGAYPGTILVNAPGATPSQVGVPVIFGVGNSRPPQVAVDKSSLQLYEHRTACFAVYNAGSGTIGPLRLTVDTPDPVVFTLTKSTITVGPANREPVCVTTDTDTPGVYRGNVLISLDGKTVLTVPILQQRVPYFDIIPDSVFIDGFPPDLPGSLNPVEHTIIRPLRLIRRLGFVGPVTYEATGNPAWVTANPPTGTFVATSTTLSLELKFTSVAQGGYYGRLTVAETVGRLHAVGLDVVVDVSNAPPKPVEVQVEKAGPLRPSEHESEVYRLVANSQVERTVQITADYGNGPPFFTFSRLPTEPSSVAGGLPSYPVQVTLSNPLPPPGVYVGQLVLTYANQVVTYPIMAIIPPAATQLSARAAAACTPKSIVPLVRTPLQNFSAKTAWPTPLSITVADDCGNLDNASSVLASFSNGDPTLDMTPAGDGVWVATWVGRNPNDHVEITFTAISNDGTLTGSASMLGSLQLNPLNPPLIFDGGVVNAASFAAGGTLSPGSFVSIFGSGLADRTLSATSVPLPNTLAGASVEIGGVNAPVFYASDGLVNAIVPYGIPVDGTLDVTVKRGDARAVSRSVAFTSAAPGIFAYGDQLGIVVGIAPNGTQALADSSHPVTAQQFIVAYCTGLGEVTPALKAGTQTPLDVLAHTVTPVTMTVGGIDAHVEFAGLAPGSTALYQVNAVLPAGVTPGDRVPVVIKAAGQSSSPVYISVR